MVVYKRVSKTVFDWKTTRLFFKVAAYHRGVVAMESRIAVVEGGLFEIDFPSHIKVQNTCSNDIEDTHKT